MTRLAAIASLAAALIIAAPAPAQSGGGFDFSWSRTTGGGGVWSAPGFELRATIGQPDAGAMGSGPFAFYTGLWGAPLAPPPPGPDPCDPGWKYSLDHGVPGANGEVYAVTTWDPDGPGPNPEWLVIGGGFTIAGNVFASNIATWDGAAWHNLGDTDSSIYDLAVYNGQLIAAGLFSQAGGVPCSRIARFDGAAWHAMDTGIADGVVRVLTVYQGDLIAGGSFTQASGLLTNNIARWNGGTWQGLGFGTDAEVRTLAVLGPDLYAGGEFLIAGAVAANRIARWDGAWHALGLGAGAGVYALAPRSNGTLAVGGAFIEAGGMPAGRIAIWAPQGAGAWQNPFAGGVAGTVYCLREDGLHLLVGGAFSNSPSMRNIMSWSPGTGFSIFGFGTDAGVWDLAAYRGVPVIVGSFTSVGPVNVLGSPTTAWGVSTFDRALCPIPACHISGGWLRLTPGFDNSIHALAVFNGELIAGGYALNSAGMVNPVNVARWNTADWNLMTGQIPAEPGGTPGTAYGPSLHPWQSVVRAITEFDGWAVIAGQFNDPLLCQNVTSWRPADPWGDLFFHALTGWHDLGANANALTTWDPDGPGGGGFGALLVAGGDFTSVRQGGVTEPAGRVAGYRNLLWHTFAGGVNGPVHALAVFNGELIVAGNFTVAGAVPAANIARLRLSTGIPAVWTWDSLGSGIDGFVHSLVTHNGSLYAGGQFSLAGGTPAANIARWDGDGWHPLSDGLGNPFGSDVAAMTSYRGDLIVGGSFPGSSGAGGAVFMNNIGRWDGAAWHALGGAVQGGGVGGPVSALVEYHGRLIVGGQFSSANGRVSYKWARWEPDVIAPAIARGAFPPGLSALCGEDLSFGVTLAYGTQPTFRWRRNGVPLFDGPTGNGSTIHNAATPGLGIENVARADAGSYDCVVSNTCGSAISAPATLTVCYANCDCSTSPPVLNVNDFICFTGAFAAGDPYADCDGSGVRNVNDFICFQGAFAAGCP